MKIIDIKPLKIKEVIIIWYSRFHDERGYFTESFSESDFLNHTRLKFLKSFRFVQQNESFSKNGTIRGLHFQWNPYMGKLVRVLFGHMVDLILDIRKESPTFGKLIAYELKESLTNPFGEWIWIPPGFAHGNFFLQDSKIEYLCTGEYSQEFERNISPLSKDIDWSLCDQRLIKIFKTLIDSSYTISNKDKNGSSVKEWKKTQESNKFLYKQLSYE